MEISSPSHKANLFSQKTKITPDFFSTSSSGKERFRELSTGQGASEKVDGNFKQGRSLLSKSADDFVGQSTPMDRSFENIAAPSDLDVSRVEVAEELQKQQNERLERLWRHQSEQNQKIYEKLDASMTRENRNACLREQHARQMEDLRHYYEGEIAGLKKQLTDMKNVIFQHEQQEGAVKGEIQKEFESLSQANLELSSKCDALEASKQLMQNQLKQATIRRQELESQCQQLMAANDIVDARSKELKRKKEETVAKMAEIYGQREKLQAKCDLITKQKVVLKNTKEELEKNYTKLLDDYQKLSDKCHKLKEESKTYRDRTKVQETLVEKTNKNVRELELVIETLKRELEDKAVKHEVDRGLFNATQQRVDRLVVQNRDKDSTIEDLEQKVRTLEATVKQMSASTAKAGLNEIRESIHRDKELLKRILHEYDSLSEKHEKTKGQVHHLEGKLAESKGEGHNLRKELSEANISRRNLESSLREVLGNQTSCRRIAERSARRTWEQPANVGFLPNERGAEQDLKNDHGMLKYMNPKESTRRFKNQAEKDEAIDLSAVKTDFRKGRGYTKYSQDSVNHSHHDHDEEHSSVCAYCNQLYKKQAINKSKIQGDAVDRRAFLVSTEKRFLELSEQRRRLESALRKISWSKMTKQDKEDKKFLENKLDEVVKDLEKIRLELRSS